MKAIYKYSNNGLNFMPLFRNKPLKTDLKIAGEPKLKLFLFVGLMIL